MRFDAPPNNNSGTYQLSRHLFVMLAGAMSVQTSADYLLAAENCATAALTATNRDDRLDFILMSIVWRNEALRLKLGDRAELLGQCQIDHDPILRL